MRNVPRRTPGSLRLAAALLFWAVQAWPQAQAQIVTDQISYDVGSMVRIDVVFPSSETVLPASDLSVTLWYAGESKPLLNEAPLSSSSVPSGQTHSTGYHEVWKIPPDARTGRYEISLGYRNSKSRQRFSPLARPGSFVVHRKLVRITDIKLDKTFYTSGDPIASEVTLENLSDRDLRNLRVEFSDRYWPWIGPTGGSTDLHIKALADALSLPAHGRRQARSSQAGVAEAVKRSAFHQYAVVVWDHDRKNIYDIAFSPLVFIQAPGINSPRPYPGQYSYSELSAINTATYRRFYPAGFDSPAIRFDRSHTMWPAGSEASVKCSITNPTGRSWHGVVIHTRLVGPDGGAIATKSVAEAIDLDPRSSLSRETRFTLPLAPGTYRVVVELTDSAGEVLAANTLELGVNALPKSIVVFCAHEDDEMGHAGLYRAAMENHIPIHFVYFTSGDAGSCDRYYQHSCSPAEALNFGYIRMQEARAALGHLGVPDEGISFLGLPDGGSGEIWRHHVESSNPYFGVLLATDHAPYEGLVRPNLPYARDAVVNAAGELIRRFQPEVIYTAHPSDVRHIDHIVNNYFVVKALQELRREGNLPSSLTLLVDDIHDPKTQPRTPYHYQDYALHVSGEVKALAQEAGWYYQSQGGTRAAGSIRTFDQLPRTEAYRQVLDWQEHEGWNERD